MSSIFACDLGLNRKTLSGNFFYCFGFRFREIFFNQHWRQMRASLILLFGKTKAFFGKDTARKKTAFLHTLFVENERETSKLKWGFMFFYKVEGHMPKLSSFGRGKKFRPKKSLTSLLHAALQLYYFILLLTFLLGVIPFAGGSYLAYGLLDSSIADPGGDQLTPDYMFVSGCLAAAVAKVSVAKGCCN